MPSTKRKNKRKQMDISEPLSEGCEKFKTFSKDELVEIQRAKDGKTEVF
jgi:hypothetical protein